MISWDEYYLQGAQWAATRSKDPSTKVGAVLVSRYNRVLSTGYNGFAPGVADAAERLNQREVKYELTIHAEENALLGCDRDDAQGSTLYVWGAPVCERCMSRAIAMGVSRVVYDYDLLLVSVCTHDKWVRSWEVAKQLAEEAGVTVGSWVR
jgi:dCMP deaminase